MIANACPKCGAANDRKFSDTHAIYECNSYFANGEAKHESWLCITRQRDALERRVRELEKAINAASVAFCGDGHDGVVAARMMDILHKAKGPQ